MPKKIRSFEPHTQDLVESLHLMVLMVMRRDIDAQEEYYVAGRRRDRMLGESLRLMVIVSIAVFLLGGLAAYVLEKTWGAEDHQAVQLEAEVIK